MRKIKCTKNGDYVTYNSMIIAEYETGVTSGTICKAIQSKKEIRGYTFEYASDNYRGQIKSGKVYSRLNKGDLYAKIQAKRLKQMEVVS